MMNSFKGELEPMVCSWLPAKMTRPGDFKIRMTYVDGAFQIYGHEKKKRHLIRSMRAYFDAKYNLEYCPEDSQIDWRLGEACVAKIDGHWYRATVIEVSLDRKDVGVIFVDLGNVRIVKSADIRIPREFGSQVYVIILDLIVIINKLNFLSACPSHQNGPGLPHSSKWLEVILRAINQCYPGGASVLECRST